MKLSRKPCKIWTSEWRFVSKEFQKACKILRQLLTLDKRSISKAHPNPRCGGLRQYFGVIRLFEGRSMSKSEGGNKGS